MKKVNIILLIVLFVFLYNNLVWSKQNKSVVFISEKDLPRRIAIVGPFALKNKNIDISAFGMVRNVIKNYMAGKGYIVIHIDDKISKWNPDFKELKKIYKKNPKLDGLLFIGVHQLSSFNIAFAQYYKMDGELCLYNRKKKLGCWRESATRKKVSIATDPLGAIATLVSSVISSSGKVHIKNTIFEWAFKISSLVPSFSVAAKKPKIFRVVTNITSKTFKVGDRIIVGIEGSPGGSAFFDISPLIKHVPMAEVQNGIYKGMYVVKEGDRLKNGVLHVVLENDRGERRDWMETEPLINIDGIPPSTAKSFRAVPTTHSIKLSWNTDDSEVIGFILLRSTNPLSGYKEIARVKNFSYEDKNVEEGKVYYYRLISLDRAGNTSKPAQLGPINLPVFTQKALPKVIVSDIPPGKYYLKGISTIPVGVKVNFYDSQISFYPGSLLKIEGTLNIKSVVLNFTNKEKNKEVSDKTLESVRKDNKDKNQEDKEKQTDVKKKLSQNVKSIFGGIEILPTGNLSLEAVQINNLPNGIKVNGKLVAKKISIINADMGVFIETLKDVYLESATFRHLKTAVVLKDGTLNIQKCKFEHNNIALKILDGAITLLNNNFMDNKINILSNIDLQLAKNFLGSEDPSNFKLKGNIKIKSFLDAPYPSGKEIKFSDLVKEAQKDKKRAMEYLNKRNYGKAVELFKRVIKYSPDVDTYIYYIYALSMINDKTVEKVIEEGIKKYPYNTKIYQLGIRYYLQANNIQKAKALWEKGLKLNPNDPSLTSMSYYFQNVEDRENSNKDKNNKPSK